MEGFRFWIFRKKLHGVVLLLCNDFGTTVNSEDFSGIEYGIADASSKGEGVAYEHHFSGENDFSVVFSADQEDNDIIRLWVKSDKPKLLDLVRHLDTVQTFIDDWTIKPALIS